MVCTIYNTSYYQNMQLVITVNFNLCSVENRDVLTDIQIGIAVG